MSVHEMMLGHVHPPGHADGVPLSFEGLCVACSIWLYAMVGTDYGGDRLIRHFIDYYHDLGVPYDRFIFVLHHNPAFPDDATSSAKHSAVVTSTACKPSRTHLRTRSSWRVVSDSMMLPVQAMLGRLPSCAATISLSGA